MAKPIFKDLLLRSYGRIFGYYPERAYQTLKIRPSAIKAIDIVLRRSVVTGFCVALLLGSSGFAGLFKTASTLYVACGLIFKGLIGYFSMITHIQSCGVNP
jgi:hypothetical protein